MACARSSSTSPARRSGPIIPRAYGRRASCASSSARSAGARWAGRFPARRSRRACTASFNAPLPPTRAIRSHAEEEREQPVRITVLGKSPAWQDANGACSGYLVEGGGQVVLLDCGPGVFAKLRAAVGYETVDAVLITHLHADHILDLVPFASGLRYRPWDGPPPRPRLIAPPGAPEAFAAVCSGAGMTPDHLELAFDLSVYDPAQALVIGALAVRFQPVPHYIPANAVELTDG